MLQVCHAPMEIAGQVELICDHLKKEGVHATGYNFFHSFLDYKGTYRTDAFELQKLVNVALDHFDLFHFHNSHTFLEDFRDLQWIKDKGKKSIMHHRGNDVRSRVLAVKGDSYENPYAYTESSFPEDAIQSNLETFSKLVDAAIVQDYELYKYVYPYYSKENKPVYVLPRLCPIGQYEVAIEQETKAKPLVVHAPTDRDFKGTAYIEASVKRLQSQHPFEFKLVEKLSHEKALELYKEADIVIDQVLCGAYGNLSIEAMAMGKPVICYLRPDLVPTFPLGLPIQSANPDNLDAVLADLLGNPAKRQELGRQGRAFVEAHHDSVKVIKQVLQIYQNLISG